MSFLERHSGGAGFRLAKILSGAAFLALAFPEGLVSTVAPLEKGVETFILEAPQLQEELAHERALREGERSLKRRRFPQVRTSFEESFVQGGLDSGFLSSVRVEIPLFQKGKPSLLWKEARLERKAYEEVRRKLQVERALEFRLAYHEAQGIRTRLARLLEKGEILEKLTRRERGLVLEKIKPIGELDQFFEERLSVEEKRLFAKARIEALLAKMAYLTGLEEKTLVIPEERGGLPPKLSEEAFERLKEEALRNHPDLVRLELEIARQAALLSLKRREWLPEVSAFSAYTQDPRFSGNEDQLFAGVRVTWDVWDFGALHYEAKKEAALLAELEAKSGNRKALLALKIEETFRSYEAAYAAWETRASYLDFQKAVLLGKKKEGLRSGVLSAKEFLLARLRFLDQEISLSEAREEALKKEAELFFALGLAQAKAGIWL